MHFHTNNKQAEHVLFLGRTRNDIPELKASYLGKKANHLQSSRGAADYSRQRMENSTEAQAACESSRRPNSESSSNTITWTDHTMQAACKEPIRKVRKGRSEPCRQRTLDAGDDRRVRKLPQHVAIYRYIGHHAWVPAVAKALVRVG